jgi:hypothetical protein
MNHDDGNELEQFISAKLRSLPERKAPPALIGNVLAALQARQALPWWQRPWATWPTLPKLAFGPVLAMCAVTIVWSLSLIPLPQFSIANTFQGWREASAPIIEAGGSLLNAVSLVVGAAQPWLLVGIAVVAIMYATCIGVGTLCLRWAFKTNTP